MSNSLDPSLNPASHTAFVAALISGSKTDPRVLQSQVESLLADMTSSSSIVLDQYKNAVALTRSLTEQALLARAIQSSDPRDAALWIAAATKLAAARVAVPTPPRRVEKHGQIITGPDGLPVDEESWDNAARFGAFKAERAARALSSQSTVEPAPAALSAPLDW
jgi:hypothetical protein